MLTAPTAEAKARSLSVDPMIWRHNKSARLCEDDIQDIADCSALIIALLLHAQWVPVGRFWVLFCF